MDTEHPLRPEIARWPHASDHLNPAEAPYLGWNPYEQDPYHPDPYAPR